ncbi:FtsW/RodA/SpoVE family cell cycle protein [Actinoplanes sp. LDG1-06]|uniref:Probable peptidoglycan glycosyltransferase FtsW n=1 Tax=Paractinoplanes ovalisporus TaxID=2810368 RepID=A0ABS2AQA7_9ACTN|nr:FtsW/RodA/SpoVE family cell cycle protein [Actinoplanes ovalisporus]MBM2622035.1 FtsW/RodA/SpoVE family cell cycle protein [Actinoplanes ovalisporus]
MFSPAGLTMLAPHVLVAAPFFFAGPAYAVWVPVILVTTVVLGRLAFNRLRDPFPGAGGYSIRGPVLAVLVTVTVLVELGALLAVRLVVVPDPRTGFGHAITADSWSAAWSALVQPLLGIIAVVLLLAFLGRRGLGRWAAWARRSDFPEEAGRPLRTAVLLTVVAVPFLLPLLFAGGGVALTAGPVATAEYGKILFCAALAFVVAQESHRFQGGRLSDGFADIRRAAARHGYGSALPALCRNYRFLLLPLGVFAVVAVASGLRHDFGTIVPAALATMGVTWYATRHNLDRNRLPGESGRHGFAIVAAYRLFVGAAVLLIAATLALLTTDYIGERGRVWNDPWRFRWDAPCAVVDAPAHVDQDVPDGRVACLRSLAADAESERSQVSRAIAATADGGLWGRGLHDRVSAAVPAGSTDFVLAVVWNKLGGLVVIAAGLLLALLSAALVRAATLDPAAGRPSLLVLFAAGLGTMLTGQFLFVLAATANVVPHTGIPAPLLSRGGQSTLAIGMGVALLLAVARADGPADRAARAPGLRPVTASALSAVLIVIVAVLTTVPYAAPRIGSLRLPTTYSPNRPICDSRTPDLDGLGSPGPDPEQCSTDLITLARTRVAVSFPGGGRLVLDRHSGDWTPENRDELAGMEADDLGRLLSAAGPLRTSYPRVMEISSGTSLRERLAPAPRDRVDGDLALTIDPARQHRIAAALHDEPSAAVVILDASTGRVLVSASTPGTAAAGDVDDEAQRDFAEEHDNYVRRDDAGQVDDSTADADCRRRSRDGAGQDQCWRWSYADPGRTPRPDGVLGQSYPYGDALTPVWAAAPAGTATRLGLRVGRCDGPQRWTADRLTGTAVSCVPDPSTPTGAHGTPLTLAVLAGAVGNGGRAVHPRIVERITYPATGLSDVTPARPPVAAFPPEVAEQLKASDYPLSDGLHVDLVTAGSLQWVCGFTPDGKTAFAAVVPAQSGADRLLSAIRTTIGDR